MKHALPNIGLIGGFVENEDGWGPDMNANLAGLSVLVQASVAGRVDALPGSPAQGDVYILTTDQRIAYYDEGNWRYIVPQAGYTAYDRELAVRLEYDGAAWAEVVAGGGDGGGGGGGGAVAYDVPSIVQKASLRNDGMLALPAAPKAGNTLLVVLSGYGGSIDDYAPPGFLERSRAYSNHDNIVSFRTRKVQAGDTGSYNLFAGDNQQATLYEIKNAGAFGEGRGGGNAFTYTNPRKFLFGVNKHETDRPMMTFVGATSDSDTTISFEPAAGLTTDFYAVDGGNHRGAHASIASGFEGMVQVNYSDSPVAACFDVFQVFGSIAGPVVTPVGFKKYRIYITQGNNATQVCMGELRCYDDAVAGTDITDQNTGIFYSAQAGANVAANVFDNNSGNGWFDTNPPINFIGFNLAEPLPVKRYTIELFFREDYMPRDFQLQGSNDDGATWTTLHTVTGKTSWVGVEGFVVPE